MSNDYVSVGIIERGDLNGVDLKNEIKMFENSEEFKNFADEYRAKHDWGVYPVDDSEYFERDGKLKITAWVRANPTATLLYTQNLSKKYNLKIKAAIFDQTNNYEYLGSYIVDNGERIDQ